MTEQTQPTDAELLAFATEEQFLLFCDPDEFTDIARSVLAKRGTPAGAGEVVACGNCGGSGRMVRDPDIGTDQECFVCDGSGSFSEPATTQPTQAQAGFKSGAKSFQTYAEANAYSKGYYAGKKAATKAQAGAVPLTVDEVEQLIAQWSYELHGDRARYLVRMTEQHHGITAHGVADMKGGQDVENH